MLWDLRTTINTDTHALNLLRAVKAGNLTPGRAATASAAAWLLTKAMMRVKSSSSRQYKGMAHRMTTTAPSGRRRSTKSHTKMSHTKIRSLLRCLGDYGVLAQILYKKSGGLGCRALYLVPLRDSFYIATLGTGSLFFSLCSFSI